MTPEEKAKEIYPDSEPFTSDFGIKFAQSLVNDKRKAFIEGANWVAEDCEKRIESILDSQIEIYNQACARHREEMEEKDEEIRQDAKIAESWSNRYAEAKQEIAAYKENVIETLYSHYKSRGGYTNTAGSFIEKITGEKWERDKEFVDMRNEIAALKAEIEELYKTISFSILNKPQ